MNYKKSNVRMFGNKNEMLNNQSYEVSTRKKNQDFKVKLLRLQSKLTGQNLELKKNIYYF